MKKIYILGLIFSILIVFCILLVQEYRESYEREEETEIDIGKVESWEKVTTNSWKPRGHHQTLVFQDKMWIIGGVTADSDISKKDQLFINHSLACDNCNDSAWATGDLNLNDVWYSADGTNWTQATASAPWSSRRDHTAVVFDNKMWIMGGYGDNKNFNDVWYSTDGVKWTQATSSAQWSPRRGHTSTVFNNRMWVVGGAGVKAWDDNLNDVWYSTDGVKWTQATDSAPWNKRSFHSSVVFNNQVWLIGGWGGWDRNFNDIWYSADGVKWKENSTNWEPMWGHTSTVFDNRMWVIGGNTKNKNNGEKNNDAGDLNDMWYSTNGIKWTRFEKDIPWEPRRALTSLAFKNKLWIIGGIYGSVNEKIFACGEVWKLSL